MSSTNRKNARRGVVNVYIAVIIVALLGMVSLAVDLGRVHTVKTELQRAADAAARAGVSSLQNITTTQDLAYQYAYANSADGSPIVLDKNLDVEFGTWNSTSKTFTTLYGSARSGATALRVTCRRIASRNTAVPLFFGSILGKSTFDIEASTVMSSTFRFYGFVGLDSVSISGAPGAIVKVDSYDSSAGPYTAMSARDNVIVGSNGNVSITGGVTVYGDAMAGGSVSISGGAIVTGSIGTLPSLLSYPAPSAGTADTVNDNASIPSSFYNGGDLSVGNNKTLNLAGGTYYLKSISASSNSTINLTGPVTIYVTGNINMKGLLNPYSTVPSTFKMRLLNSGTSVDFGAKANTYIDLYAPLSTVKISGSVAFCGCIIGKTLTVSGGSSLHYDEALGTASSVSVVSMVK